MKIRNLLLPALLCLSASAHAVPITYSFSATYSPRSDAEGSLSTGVFGPSPPPSLFAPTDVVTGTFVYDSEIPLTFSTASGASVYLGAFTQLRVSIAGQIASDPAGIAAISPDYVQFPAPGLSIDDVVEFHADPRIDAPGADSTRDLNGFIIGDWTLVDVGLSWIDVSIFGDDTELLPTGALPSVLPPSGYLPADSRVVLAFVDTTGDRVRTSSFDNLTVAPVSVPEPHNLALMSLGILMGAALRRRKRA